MYSKFFGLKDSPFSIAPDPRFLYMSERHREGLAHLLYGVSGYGGFVLLTGEVGTGKTTVCRCFLEQVPDNTDIAFIIHPKLTGRELLASICDELSIAYPRGASTKVLVDLINLHLLQAHASGRNTVVIIDEAQNLSTEVLEQLRLLTNLETSEKKLLQIVLLGQPELVELLQRPELRQLSQRITARYHLRALTKEDVRAYVYYRLSVAGLKREIFTPGAFTLLFKLSQGIPRLINLICDRAMLGAYARHSEVIDRKILKQAAKEVLGETKTNRPRRIEDWLIKGALTGTTAGLFMLAILSFWSYGTGTSSDTAVASASVVPSRTNSQAESVTPEDAESTGTTSSSNGPLPISTASNNATEREPAGEMDAFQQALGNISGDSRAQAYAKLFQRWGIEYQATEHPLACEFAETVGLRCLHRQGNWRSLLTLDRPAILRLRSLAGDEIFVALQAIDDSDIATVDVGEVSLRTKVAALDALWAGEYSLLWNAPPFSTPVIRADGNAEQQAWLAERLTRVEAKLAGMDIPLGQGVVLRDNGDSLENRVRQFQVGMGLLPDGIAGAHTLIHMSSLIDLDVPRLKAGQSVAQPKADQKSAQLGGAN